MLPTFERPLPMPDDLTRPFWEAAGQRRLVVQRCQSCRTYYHPPVPECKRCMARRLRTTLAFEQVSGRGVIYSYFLVNDSRLTGFRKATPYPIVVVELEEQTGLIMFVNMPETRVEGIDIGKAVEVIFVEAGPGVLLPDFRLAPSAR